MKIKEQKWVVTGWVSERVRDRGVAQKKTAHIQEFSSVNWETVSNNEKDKHKEHE